jgi:hypothetical protein
MAEVGNIQSNNNRAANAAFMAKLEQQDPKSPPQVSPGNPVAGRMDHFETIGMEVEEEA